MPSLLLTLTFLPKVPCLQVAFSPIDVPSIPPASLPISPGQPASLTAQDLPELPWVAFGRPLEGMEGAGQGGAGQALM